MEASPQIPRARASTRSSPGHAGLRKTPLLEAAGPTRGQTPDCRITGEQERFVLQSSPMETYEVAQASLMELCRTYVKEHFDEDVVFRRERVYFQAFPVFKATRPDEIAELEQR